MLDPLVLDNLRPGAEVISTDSKTVGKLHAVVVDPRDEEVTHIVVNAGPFFPEPGFGAPKLVNVPIEEMADAREKKIILKCTKAKFERMPDYAEWVFGPPPPSWTHTHGLPSDSVVWWMEELRRLEMLGWAVSSPGEITHKKKLEREIQHDARVWRVEPHIHIGEVDRVLMDEVTEEVEALVVRRGILFGHDVILPIHYVTEVRDDLVYVQITDAELEHLEPFHAPPEPS